MGRKLGSSRALLVWRVGWELVSKAWMVSEDE